MKKLPLKTVNIIGFPMDLGSGRRGVDMGPSAIRIAGIEKKLLRLGYKVVDSGDIFVKNIEHQSPKTMGTNPKLKYLPEILKTTKILAKKVEKVLNQGQFPLCLGGDHSMAIGTIAGISSYCKTNKLKMGVIWVDAHADMNTDKTTPSGNIHGMPLAASLGIGDEKLVNFYDFAPKIKPENCVLIGLRRIDTLEKENIKKLGLTVYTMNDIDKLGIHKIIAKVLKEFKKNVDHLHISFDLDSVDPFVVPGVGTPVPGGLSYREAHLIMESIAECRCMSSLEITEVNPILDNRNKSAEFAIDIIASSLGQRIL
jgi:arginase